jgi:thiazole synthase ThiGH ThiG subunit
LRLETTNTKGQIKGNCFKKNSGRLQTFDKSVIIGKKKTKKREILHDGANNCVSQLMTVPVRWHLAAKKKKKEKVKRLGGSVAG